MVTDVLSVENALEWSWGIVFRRMVGHLRDWNFVRIERRPKFPVYPALTEHFPVTLVQNADNLPLIKSAKGKVLTRMGGMVIDEKNDPTRYDRELEQCGGVIATSRQLFDIAKRVNQRVMLGPNPVDLEMCVMRPLPWDQRKDDRSVAAMQPFTVGFAGNIWGMGSQYKGWPFYVQMTLKLYGEVEHKECLHNGPDNQKQIPHERMVPDFYHKVDVLILPSAGEGCSNVTGEAMACGVPVVTTKVGYHGEMLEDGVNCLFVERDVNQIVDAVRRLKEDGELYRRIADNGRRFIEEYQDLKKIVPEYDRALKAICCKE